MELLIKFLYTAQNLSVLNYLKDKKGCQNKTFLVIQKKYIEIRRKTQGSLIEPQVGLFVTANAPDQYARMYFGRVCDTNTESTGFCVSEFIDGEAGRNNAWFDIRSNGYRITALDAHAGNHINGKVIDYGGILVTDAQGKNLTIDDN